MGDLRHDAPTPAMHGYAQCQRCRTWLRPGALSPSGIVDNVTVGVCVDTGWCSRQAGVGRGALEIEAPTTQEDNP